MEDKKMMKKHDNLGNILLRKRLITEKDLIDAIEQQKKTGQLLGEIFIEKGLISEDDLVESLAEQIGISFCLSSDNLPVSEEDARMIPRDIAEKHRVVGVRRKNGSFVVAMADPFNVMAIDDLKAITKLNIVPIIATRSKISEYINKIYRKAEPEEEKIFEILTHPPGTDYVYRDIAEEDINLDNLRSQANDPPVIRLVNHIILKGINDRASDIHIEPLKNILNVRYRIDGVLYPLTTISRDLKMAVTSRIKILANMDIAERRLPQDGRFTVIHKKREVDIRVSTLPGIFGEKVVLRLLIKETAPLRLKQLGLHHKAEEVLIKHIKKPQGMVLLTGPTGSGKTTTLYACLNEIDIKSRNVVTIEDPVEYQLPGIHQVRVNPKIGLTFANGLRHILRQDPDVIMVGEIRDQETAEMAVRSALTGHLVFSTLHTNDALGTVVRLVNMGIEPFLVATAVNLVGSQRLVRRICPECREPYKPAPQLLEKFNLLDKLKDGFVFYRGRGCDFCKYVGYYGRMAILEYVELNREMRKIIMENPYSDKLREEALRAGMVTLKDAGVHKVLSGETTIEEIIRVCVEEE